MATKKSTRVNKSAFVRLHPKMSPSEIVALAKEDDISLDEKYVHNVRWKDKSDTIHRGFIQGGRRKNSVNQPKRTRRPRAVIETQNMSEQFCMLAMDLGLVKASLLIGQIRQAAQAVKV